MKIVEYLKGVLGFIFINIIILGIIVLILYMSNLNFRIVMIIVALYLINLCMVYGFEYMKQNKFLNEVNEILSSLDEKYLLSEIMAEPENAEFREFYDILKQCNKSMNDRIGRLDSKSREFKEFIELWVHEVKTPISSARLTIENHRNIITESLEEDILRIEYFIEQALFYARSGSVNKDFLVKAINLDQVVNNSIKKYSKLLIKNRVKIHKDTLNIIVYSDDKWIEFILGQIISNSIKYFDKEEKILEFKTIQSNDFVTLMIKDNGIGIEEKYLSKIFEKGFTGNNGRSVKEATGLGLYLCKKLSEKIHIKIEASSVLGKETVLYVTFPKSSQFFLK